MNRKVLFFVIAQLLCVSLLFAQNKDNVLSGKNEKFFINCGCASSSFRTNPLFLIDGVESSAEDLGRLSPDDIESFFLLKDSRACLIYGEHGTNGVIVVFTKVGSKDLLKNLRKENLENNFPDLKIYPNPFSGTLHLVDAEGSTLQVFSTKGAVKHTQKIVSPDEIIPLKRLRAGEYFICVKNGTQAKMVKIVKT